MAESQLSHWAGRGGVWREGCDWQPQCETLPCPCLAGADGAVRVGHWPAPLPLPVTMVPFHLRFRGDFVVAGAGAVTKTPKLNGSTSLQFLARPADNRLQVLVARGRVRRGTATPADNRLQVLVAWRRVRRGTATPADNRLQVLIGAGSPKRCNGTRGGSTHQLSCPLARLLAATSRA